MCCELPTVYTESNPTARKKHNCCECRGVIQIGEKYNKFEGLWDGKFSTYKTCLDCFALRHLVKRVYHEDITVFGYLYELIFEKQDKSYINQYLDIKRKRGADIPNWMLKYES